MKATLYNREELKEYGAFFHINSELWSKEPSELKKRNWKVNPFELVDNYHLEHILKKGGWKILEEALVLDTNLKKMQVVGIKIMKGISPMEQIENILNSESMFSLYKSKEDAEESKI